jgi:hypothetical protein
VEGAADQVHSCQPRTMTWEQEGEYYQSDELLSTSSTWFELPAYA